MWLKMEEEEEEGEGEGLGLRFEEGESSLAEDGGGRKKEKG